MDDARFNLSVALTAARYGATVLNYVSATGICKERPKGNRCAPVKIIGAKVKDQLTSEEFCIKAKCVINATGAFTDTIRKFDQKEAACMCTTSCGVHLVLPGFCYFQIYNFIIKIILSVSKWNDTVLIQIGFFCSIL